MKISTVHEEQTGIDYVNHPPHYTKHESGIECIQVAEHMSFCLGNAVKYIWRAGEKGCVEEDLRKAIWYLEREIQRLKPKEKWEQLDLFPDYKEN